MTSQINPNLIDATYPIAGQDNNTQGFRDNFNAIKNNFQYAEDEINALQAGIVSKGGNTINDMGGAVLFDTVLRNEQYTHVNLGNTGNAVTINYAAGSFQSFTANTDVVLNFSNLPPAGNAAVITLEITPTAADTVTTPYTVTLPNVANVSVDNSGVIGLVGNVLTFPRSNADTLSSCTYQFITNDNGSSFVVNPVSTVTQPLSATSEDLAASANVNLGVSDSYFSTSAAETATLPAGVNGQVKVLAMYGRVGDMVITVTNPGWGGAGTITFDAVGDACTLKYINNKWFCIGNNGCTFA